MENKIKIKLEKYEGRNYQLLQIFGMIAGQRRTAKLLGFIFYKKENIFSEEYNEYTLIKSYIHLLLEQYIDQFRDKIETALYNLFPLDTYKHKIKFGYITYL